MTSGCPPLGEAEFHRLRDVLRMRGEVELKVITGSMAPVIRPQDSIRIVPLERDPRPFEIIVYLDERGRLICHYVWRLNRLPDVEGRQILITRPLASGGEDLPVRRDRVLGRVVSQRISWLRRASLLLRAVLSRRL